MRAREKRRKALRRHAMALAIDLLRAYDNKHVTYRSGRMGCADLVKYVQWVQAWRDLCWTVSRHGPTGER